MSSKEKVFLASNKAADLDYIRWVIRIAKTYADSGRKIVVVMDDAPSTVVGFVTLKLSGIEHIIVTEDASIEGDVFLYGIGTIRSDGSAEYLREVPQFHGAGLFLTDEKSLYEESTTDHTDLWFCNEYINSSCAWRLVYRTQMRFAQLVLQETDQYFTRTLDDKTSVPEEIKVFRGQMREQYRREKVSWLLPERSSVEHGGDIGISGPAHDAPFSSKIVPVPI